MSHYDEQREQQIAAWEAYAKANKEHAIETRKTILSELLEVFKDTREDSNITFRGFLLGNYSLPALRADFPNLYRYINTFGEKK